MKKLTIIIALSVIICTFLILSAQHTGSIEGIITDSNNDPLPGVVIKLESSEIPQPRYYTSNEEGKYFFLNIPAGEYTLEFRMMGFKTMLRPAVVEAGKTTMINAYLEEIAWEENVVITGTGPVFDAYRSIGNDTIGFAVGGAMDIENFRKNIENNYLPLPTDITYEGIYYDYFFDTGQLEPCKKLFCPSYSLAVSKDPFSGREEYYLQVGLNSGITQTDFQRKKLNLVIVLDISGSMSAPFNRYYYDQFGKRTEREEDEEFIGKSKMAVANECVVALLDHLKPYDHFGMVLFSGNAHVFFPITNVGEIDMKELKRKILNIRATGSTNMAAGMRLGSEQLKDFIHMDSREYENRIIFIADAMPNRGDLSEQGLLGIAKRVSNNRIYSTFIGVGLDFNSELVDFITKIRGGNYYSVHSGREFKERMDDEFEFMVTPLVFNLGLSLESQGFEIEKVYGSPEADIATGELMKINTLFPSKRRDGETKGGIVILKLEKTGRNPQIRLKTSYENRAGVVDGSEAVIKFTDQKKEHFDNNGIRKGILLARYVNLMRNWIEDERDSHNTKKPLIASICLERGIKLPPDINRAGLGRWERQSIPLRVSNEYKYLFSKFLKHFELELKEIEDESLKREIDILKKLIEYES